MTKNQFQSFRNILKKLRDYYLSLAIILMNVVLLFFFLNLFSYIFIKIFIDDSFYETPYYSLFIDLLEHPCLSKGYPDYSTEEVREIVKENWIRLRKPYSFTGSLEAPYSGEYVNVSDEAYRNVCDQGPWPLNENAFNILVFGGSTTFGYGVTDCETIPSYLQDFLSYNAEDKNVHVYNFGQGGYASSHERLFFTDLLFQMDVKPNLVIFIDGLNDFYYDSYLIEDLSNQNSNSSLLSTVQKLPLIKLKNILLNKSKESSSSFSENACEGVNTLAKTTLENNEELIPSAQANIELYLENKKVIEAIAQSFNIETLFVWQPIPTYKYDGVYYFSDLESMALLELQAGIGYEQMELYLGDNIGGENFLWLADPEGIDELNCYIDKTHYTSDCTKFIADKIFQYLQAKYFEPSAKVATGHAL